MRSRHSFFSATLAAGAIVLLVASGLAACSQDPDGAGGGQGPGGQQPPAQVTVVKVSREDVRVEADYAARLYGAREAEVRARVNGILEERLYEEGEVVEQDAALFRIDPAPYRIAVQRAEAEVADAQAALNQAEREWRRIQGLFAQRVVSESDRDRALSNRELAQARLAVSEASVDQARLELGYTTVRAPVSGVTGLEAVTPGNLVSHGDLLTTVTQLDPIQARFALPGEEAAARRMLAVDAAEDVLAARLLSAGGELYEHAGEVDYTASTVDARTGNVIMRAVFSNPEHHLMPGSLARVRLATRRLEGVFLVDPAAVSQGPSGPVLFVVGDDDKARARQVRLGPLIDGKQVVLEGLADGERAVVNGQVALRDGADVAPQTRGQRAD
jgi:membrane fusion protein, multidrug efflux system